MSRQPLSRERVLEAAIRVADRGGVEAISMRRVAQDLGVEAMSLYHHVPNKDAVLDGVVDVVFAAIDLPSEQADWRKAIHGRASSARAVLSRHRWALDLVDSRRNPGPVTLRHHNAVLGVLREAGFSVEMAVHAISLIDSYVYGFVIQEASLPEPIDEVAAGILEHAEGMPYLQEVIAHQSSHGLDMTREFDFGLQLILDALEARVRA